MVTVFVPAFNEEKYLEKVIRNIILAKRKLNNLSIEIIIVDDGSTDRTPEIVNKLKKRHPFIRSIRHLFNKGFGAGWRETITQAKYPHLIIIPGDNDAPLELIITLIRHRNIADAVFGYYINKEGRSRLRNIFSYIYQLVYMITFDIYLQQLNCVAVYKTKRLRELDLKSTRFTISAEINIKLLRLGYSFSEVAGYMQTDLDNFTPLKLKNMWEVFKTYLLLVYEILIIRRKVYNKRPIRVRLKE